MSQGSFFKASPDMISFPSLVTSDPDEFLSPVRADVEWPPAVGRVGGFGGGWDARAGFPVSSFAGVSQPQLGSPPKKKNFSLVTPPGITVRNSLPALAKGRIQLGPGEPGKPAPRAPGRGRGGGVRPEPGTPGDPRAPIPDGGRTRPAGAKTSPGRGEPRSR